MTLPTLYGSLASKEIQAQLQEAQKNPSRWTVYLVPERGDQRTIEQNRLLMRAAQELAVATGNNVTDCRDMLVERFLGYEDHVTEDGDIIKTLVATASLTVPEFTAFIYQMLPWVEAQTGRAVASRNNVDRASR